ncbi:hypothetical protein [Vibrio cholerae]|uniref:hypothetical protein n=1 Tax=Vibrio cholerae TaxID=666 RepID=UPI00115FE91A|nr:hypothetical protein [Vibrio cholerae]
MKNEETEFELILNSTRPHAGYFSWETDQGIEERGVVECFREALEKMESYFSRGIVLGGKVKILLIVKQYELTARKLLLKSRKLLMERLLQLPDYTKPSFQNLGLLNS